MKSIIEEIKTKFSLAIPFIFLFLIIYTLLVQKKNITLRNKGQKLITENQDLHKIIEVQNNISKNFQEFTNERLAISKKIYNIKYNTKTTKSSIKSDNKNDQKTAALINTRDCSLQNINNLDVIC